MSSTPEPLPARDRELLEFERGYWKHPGAKEGAIRERFGCSLTRYYQRLHAIVDKPAAVEYDAAHVRRLREARDERRRRAGRSPAQVTS